MLKSFDNNRKVKKFWNLIDNDFDYFSPESTIINIYGLKDYMGGHKDDAEMD